MWWIKKEECCGCSACEQICQFLAISMLQNEEGFLYPVVDINKCKKCNACVNVCPVIKIKSGDKVI